MYEWCTRFHDSRQLVSGDVRIVSPHAAVTADNINRVENCILKDRCMKVCEIEVELSLGVSFVKKIIPYHLKFCKLPIR